jgi:hypothetical protein
MDLRPAKAYRLPTALRGELAKPFGPIFSTGELAASLKPSDTVLAVGDVVSLTLKRMGFTPRLFVCDYQTQRGGPGGSGAHAGVSGGAANEYEAELGSWGEVAFRVRNPAATITREAWDAIRIALEHGKGPVRVVVEGEEDLLGIPCFLEAPLGAKVLYGMPGKGVVVVEVTPVFQERVRALLARFAH